MSALRQLIKAFCSCYSMTSSKNLFITKQAEPSCIIDNCIMTCIGCCESAYKAAPRAFCQILSLGHFCARGHAVVGSFLCSSPGLVTTKACSSCWIVLILHPVSTFPLFISTGCIMACWNCIPAAGCSISTTYPCCEQMHVSQEWLSSVASTLHVFWTTVSSKLLVLVEPAL